MKAHLLVLMVAGLSHWVMHGTPSIHTESSDNSTPQDTTATLLSGYKLMPRSSIANERRLLILSELLKEPSRFKYRFGGYIRMMSYADSRQVIGSEPDDYVMLLPRPVLLDPCGDDINARGEFHMIPFETRLLTYILGPDVCGFPTHGRIEGDFLGRVNAIDLFDEPAFLMERLRLRHAYIDMEGETASLRLGQAWHPLTFPLEAPNTLSFETGAPFNPILRMPQLTATFFSKKFDVLLALLARRNNVDNGPLGFTSVYSSRSLIPDMHVHTRIYSGDNYIGGGLSYGRLMPQLATDCTFKTRSTTPTIVGTFYGKLNVKNTALIVKCTMAENGTFAGVVGGYAVKCVSTLTDQQRYTNLRSVGIWAALLHEREYIDFGLFVGYLRNRGFKDPIVLEPPSLQCESIVPRTPTIFGFLANVHTAWRIQPRMRILCDTATFGFELAYTGAIWGDFSSSGKLVNLQPSVYNLRALFSVKYNFA